jgi:hypothetical protein
VDNPPAARSHRSIDRLCCLHRVLIGECMSSEPLPLPEIWSDPPKGEVETARAELFGNSRSSLVLIEYASGYAQQPDLQAFIRPVMQSRQPAPRERLPSLAPAALLKGLADLGSIVTQAEALLRAQGTLKSDAHFAVEHIHDVAMALRMRDVEAVLCDTLDASVREVGDALVRHEAAATGAFSAAGLLRDVMRRLEDLAVVAARMSAADTETPSQPPISEADVGTKPSPPVVGEAVVIEPVVNEELHGADEGLGATLSTEPEEEGAQLSQPQAAETPRAGAFDVFAPDDEQGYASQPAASDRYGTIAANVLAADAAVPEVTSADAFATDLVATDLVATDTVVADAAAADTVAVDAVASDIVASDTVASDIVATDATSAFAVTADIIIADTFAAAADTTATDTVAAEIVVSDPAISDTVAADGLAAETATTDSLITEIVASDAVATDVAAPETIAADTMIAVATTPDAAPHDVSTGATIVSDPLPQSQAVTAPENKVAVAVKTTAPVLPYEENLLAPSGREAQPAASAPGPQGDDVVAARCESASAPIRETDATSLASRATPTNDPLAVLYGLSEEELIALFS